MFVQTIGGEHRHIAGLHVRKKIHALTVGLGLDDFEAMPVAQFGNPVEISPQTFRITVPGTCPKVVQRAARHIFFFIKQIHGEPSDLALVTGQQCLHQDQINCLDEPGVHEFLQIASHRESPF